jgi:SAM-dependent methyltransferase
MRQVEFATKWGHELPPDASVLEIGCADGYVTEQLARRGLSVTAVDLSEKMIESARSRLAAVGLEANFAVADIDNYVPDHDFDVILGCMRTFFRYASDPSATIGRLARRTTRKLIVDLDPKLHSRQQALQMLRDAGFPSADWRPLFVPQNFRMSATSLRLLRSAEGIPGLRDLILRKKFNIVVKGERPG